MTKLETENVVNSAEELIKKNVSGIADLVNISNTGNTNKKVAASTRSGVQTSEYILLGLVIVGIFALIFTDKITVDQAVNLWPVVAGALGYGGLRTYLKAKLGS